MRILQEEYAKDKHYALLKDDLHQTARALQDAYNNLENDCRSGSDRLLHLRVKLGADAL